MSQPQPEERKKTDSKLDPSDTGTKASGIADTVTPVALSSLQETLAPTSNVPTDDEVFEIDSLIAKTSVPKETDESSSQGATQDFAVDSGATADFTVESAPNQKHKQPAIPKMIGGYEIKRILGRGGMGIVYKAKQKKLDRIVALKMVLAGSHASSEQLLRFIAEAKAVGHLQHPNIVQIFDVGEHEGLPFFSLEYVDGDSLDKRLQGKPLAPVEAAKLLEILSRAMQYAHDHGILHRDLKPANVLLTQDGVPKIADFGLAKRLEDADDSSSTRTGTIMGTPSYMSPEQASGSVHELGPATDQYSLGAMLYEFLTGRPPFLAAKAVETILKVLREEPVPPRQLQSTLPLDLETICLKALQKDPRSRYGSCTELADDLSRFLKGEPILARPVGTVERTWRWCRRNPMVASLLATSMFLLAGTAGVSSYAALSLSAKNKVVVAANELAETRRLQAVQKQLEAEESKKLAEQNADVAKKQALGSVQTIQNLVFEVNRKLSDAPATLPLKKEILQKAKLSLDRIPPLLIDPTKTSVEATDLAFHQEMGKLYYELGDVKKATEFAEKSKQIAEMRVVVRQGSNASRRNLAGVLEKLAIYSQEAFRDLPASIKMSEEALRIRQEVIDKPKRDPDSKAEEDEVYGIFLDSELAESHANVATGYLRIGNVAKSSQHFGISKQLRQKMSDAIKSRPDIVPILAKFQQSSPAMVSLIATNALSKSLLATGEIAYREGNLDEALAEYQSGIELCEPLVKVAPQVLRVELARAVGNLGDLYVHRQEYSKAKSEYNRALTLTEEIAKADPDRVINDRYLGLHNYRLGCLEDTLGNTIKAEEYFNKSLVHHRKVFDIDNSNERRHAELMLTLARTASVTEAIEIADAFAARPNLDSEMLVDVARCYAQCSRHAGEREKEFVLKAREMLARARAQGFADEFWLRNELDLKPLFSS